MDKELFGKLVGSMEEFKKGDSIACGIMCEGCGRLYLVTHEAGTPTLIVSFACACGHVTPYRGTPQTV